MSWTRRRMKTSSNEQPYAFHDDLSFDSGSDESTYKMLAFLSQPIKEPLHSVAAPTTPQAPPPQKALDYYVGLFEPHDHIAYDPAFSRYFIFLDEPADKSSRTYPMTQPKDKFR